MVSLEKELRERERVGVRKSHLNTHDLYLYKLELQEKTFISWPNEK